MAGLRLARLTLLGVLAAAPCPALADGPESGSEPSTVRGQAVDLASAPCARGLPADPDATGRQVVLLAADGSITPLLCDDASRALFLDERLRDRPAEVKGRKHPGLPYLQVVSFKVDDQGTLRTPEYYCDVCSITVRYPQICPCCQGPMELRMQP